MRHHLLEWEARQKKLVHTEHPRELPPDLACHVAALVLARKGTDARTALRRLGVDNDMAADISQWDVNKSQLFCVLRRYVLVILGPKAQVFWRVDGASAGQASQYTTAVCAFCLEAGLHCACEHIHVALIHTEAMDLTTAQLPKRNAHHRQAIVASQLSPAEKHAMTLSPPGPRADAGPRASGPAPVPVFHLEHDLKRLLIALGLGALQGEFQTQEITLDWLVQEGLPGVRTYVPTIKVVRASCLVRYAGDHDARTEFLRTQGVTLEEAPA